MRDGGGGMNKTSQHLILHPSYFILFKPGAGDEIRTRDPQLGRLMLYQLSYTRPFLKFQISDLKFDSANQKSDPI
jgi:hypothetical protein